MQASEPVITGYRMLQDTVDAVDNLGMGQYL